MIEVEYRVIDRMPGDLPAAVVATPSRMVVLVDRHLTVEQVCQVLTAVANERTA